MSLLRDSIVSSLYLSQSPLCILHDCLARVYVFSWRNMKQAKTVMHKGQAPQTKAVKLGGESLSRNVSKGIYLTLEVTSSVRQWQQCIVHSLGHTWIFSEDTQSNILQYWYGFCEQFPSRVASSICSFRVRKIKSARQSTRKSSPTWDTQWDLVSKQIST